jgi:hypothetical protein
MSIKSVCYKIVAFKGLTCYKCPLLTVYNSSAKVDLGLYMDRKERR